MQPGSGTYVVVKTVVLKGLGGRSIDRKINLSYTAFSDEWLACIQYQYVRHGQGKAGSDNPIDRVAGRRTAIRQFPLPALGGSHKERKESRGMKKLTCSSDISGQSWFYICTTLYYC